jgi:branched-chain amino acid aminotransferase
MTFVSIDGALIAPEQASVSVFDRGLLYGDGLFEVLRTWSGVAKDLDAHLARLRASADLLGLRVPSELAAWAHTVITAAAEKPDKTDTVPILEFRVRIVVTRGPGPLSARLAELGPGRTIVIVEPLPEQPREIALATVEWPLPRRRGPAHKTLAYLDHVIARELAAAAGADEALRLDADGFAIECATANVFAVVGGAVVTPPSEGALPGIVRARVLALCDELAIAAGVRRLSPVELAAADEIFITSSLRGVVPVTRLDGTPRAAGPVTARIAEAYTRAMLL